MSLATNNLASLMASTDRLEEALDLHRQALAINRTAFGDGHVAMLRSLYQIGRTLYDLKRFEEAEPNLARAVDGARALGSNLPKSTPYLWDFPVSACQMPRCAGA